MQSAIIPKQLLHLMNIDILDEIFFLTKSKDWDRLGTHMNTLSSFSFYYWQDDPTRWRRVEA